METKEIINYVLILLGFIITYWKQKVDLEKRLTQLNMDLEVRKTDMVKLEAIIDKILVRRDAFEKETFKQFNDIQLQLTKTLTVLNENLKHLTTLVKTHDDQIQRLIDKNH